MLKQWNGLNGVLWYTPFEFHWLPKAGGWYKNRKELNLSAFSLLEISRHLWTEVLQTFDLITLSLNLTVRPLLWVVLVGLRCASVWLLGLIASPFINQLIWRILPSTNGSRTWCMIRKWATFMLHIFIINVVIKLRHLDWGLVRWQKNCSSGKWPVQLFGSNEERCRLFL